MYDRLFYYVACNGCYRLCIPAGMIVHFLAIVYDDRHHFGINKMLYDLRAVHFNNKTAKVTSFVVHCAGCHENQTDRAKPPGSLQPIQSISRLYILIVLDFIVGLPEILSNGIM